MGNIFGYGRISSSDQNGDRQMVAFYRCGIPDQNIFLTESQAFISIVRLTGAWYRGWKPGI